MQNTSYGTCNEPIFFDDASVAVESRIMSMRIELAYDELDKIRELFVEYQTEISINLCFQNFEDELANLPGKYALPEGRLYIATLNEKLAGCVALRAIDEEHCEMKRLYVRKQFRGFGIARALVEKIINDAKNTGYSKMLLDTFFSMQDAISLYRKFGFTEIEPYYNNPNNDVIYLGLDLCGYNDA